MGIEKKTILVVEDQEINRKILVNILKNEYDILEAENGKDALEILESATKKIACILLDIVMPVMSGYDLLDAMRERDYLNIPVIVMTGEKDPQSEEKALTAGAWDFVSKPYKANVLMRRLTNAIAKSEMDLIKKVTHLAEHDILTDLYNRIHFFDKAAEMIKDHLDLQLVFVKLDIRRFKLFNTFYGEKGGNKLLCHIAQKLSEILEEQPVCTYGRIGRDEFGFCMSYEKEQCDALIAKIHDSLVAYDSELPVEPCFGVYVIEDKNVAVEHMFNCASMAANKCKEKNLDYVGYYDRKLGDQMLAEQEIIAEMNHALEEEQFVVYFQPKYNLQTKMPYGAEALVRWKHPVKGMIPPGAFIPVFEANGFIAKLDYYMWEKVCKYLRQWMDEGIDPAPISVNMSRLDVSNPALVDTLSRLVETYQVPANLFNLELTESAYMDNPESINQVIERLHAAGFTILMDDFGSGYSSLNTLKDFDVDILKVDMKFLPVDSGESRSKKILTSVLRMAGWLRIPVIVEGVETAEQNDFLESIGCEYIQGYYYAKPMPAEAYRDLIVNVKPVKAMVNSDFEEGFYTSKVPDDIKRKIYQDDITRAYNRRYLNEWIFLDIDDEQKESKKLGIIYVKFLNEGAFEEQRGRLFKDKVLGMLADELIGAVRKKDAVVRFSDDEFLVVLIDCPEHVVVNKRMQIIDIFEKTLNLDGQSIDIMVKVGDKYTGDFIKSKEFLYGMIEEASR